MKKYKLIFTIILVISTMFCINTVYANSNAYGYDYYGKIVSAPDAYFVKQNLTNTDLKLIDEYTIEGNKIKSDNKIVDIKFYKNKIYILTNKNLKIYDENYNLEETLFDINFPFEGEILTDTIKEGMSMDISNDVLYISDKNSEPLIKNKKEIGIKSRILLFDLLNNLKYIKSLRILYSQNVPGISKDINNGFTASKIRVDKSDHIYVIAENIYQGIIEIDTNSNFRKFVGTNKVSISAIDAFWKKLAPKGTTDKKLYIPSEFSSLSVDEMGFVYATTKTKDIKPVQKFNYKGQNVLVENGNTKVVGDIFSSMQTSTFVDIDINSDGIYLGLTLSEISDNVDANLVDTNKYARVFAYNQNGQLLYTFGNYGTNSKVLMQNPKIIKWHNNDIIIVDDKGLYGSSLIILTPTEYGKNINTATSLYNIGLLDKSLDNWKKVEKLNTNNDLAYVGMGKIYYQKEEYNKALKYFELGNNKIYYSKAYSKVRNEKLRVAIPIIIGSVVVLVIGVKIYKIWKKHQKI